LIGSIVGRRIGFLKIGLAVMLVRVDLSDNLLDGSEDSRCIPEEEAPMGKIDCLILKICLGIIAATNFVACIITTDIKVLIPLNIVVVVICFSIFLFMESKYSGLAADLGISKKEARKLISDYFNYYKNVERISIYEYFDRTSTDRDDKLFQQAK
jgi:hypothetical protein